MNHHILRPYLPEEPDLVSLAQVAQQREPKPDGKKDPPVNPPLISPVVPITSKNSAEFWSIDGVSYRGNFYTVDLGKKLLDDGNSHTQDEWAIRAKEEMPKGELYTPDYPLFYGIVKSAKVAGLEDVRTFLKDTSRAKWLMTLTRIQYAPKGKDTLIHNYGTNDVYQTHADFIGKDDLIKNTLCTQAYQALLGTSDSIQEINSLFQWLNETDTYIFRVNARPKKNIDERVAWFDAYSAGAGLYCDGDPSGSYSSLGVRLCKKISGGNLP